MTLAQLALAAILSLARAPAVDAVAERPRLGKLAAAIAAAAEAGPCPFAGSAAPVACTLALVAIAHSESGFGAKGCDCRWRGDLDKSRIGALGCFQLLGPQSRDGHPPAEVCADVGLQAQLALRVLTMHAERCSRAGALAAFSGYASGKCAHRSIVVIRDAAGNEVRRFDPGLAQCLTWERLTREAGLVGASCWTRREIRTATAEGDQHANR